MSAPSSAVSEQQSKIRTLIASNLYDTKIVGELEENVKFQIKTGSYDADSNRELLKLYAVAPDMIKLDILTRLMVKCLMELPAPDFYTSLYLLKENLHALEPIKQLMKLHSMLETCQFKKFWKEMDAFKASQANAALINFAEVKDFDQAIRKFISLTIATTYSAITSAQLKELWNLNDKKAFEDCVSQTGWTLSEEGKTVLVKSNASGKEHKEVRSEHPSIEQLSKLLSTAV